jgi:hypothetical protein
MAAKRRMRSILAGQSAPGEVMTLGDWSGWTRQALAVGRWTGSGSVPRVRTSVPAMIAAAAVADRVSI